MTPFSHNADVMISQFDQGRGLGLGGGFGSGAPLVVSGLGGGCGRG